MKKHNISSLDELSIKSKNNLEWFWESVDKDIGIIWDEPYTKTLDMSNGIAWSKWFINGKTNMSQIICREIYQNKLQIKLHIISYLKME